MGYNGEGATIGVYDSGVDFDHPALAGKKAFDYDNNVQDGIEYSITSRNICIEWLQPMGPMMIVQKSWVLLQVLK